MRALGDVRDAARRCRRSPSSSRSTARVRARGRRSMRSRGSRDPSSVPLFKARLSDKDRDPPPRRGRGARAGLGDTSERVGAPGRRRQRRRSEMVRAAMAFALQKLGQQLHLAAGRIASTSSRTAPQVAGLPDRARPVRSFPRSFRICRTRARRSAPTSRQVLGALGGDRRRWPRSQPLTRDADRDVAQAATRALDSG